MGRLLGLGLGGSRRSRGICGLDVVDPVVGDGGMALERWSVDCR